jgi:hypothetical protein
MAVGHSVRCRQRRPLDSLFARAARGGTSAARAAAARAARAPAFAFRPLAGALGFLILALLAAGPFAFAGTAAALPTLRSALGSLPARAAAFAPPGTTATLRTL